MAAGVVLDTSFLIALGDNTRKHHETARRYWQYFLESEIPVYLPVIAVAEFYVKQEIPPEVLRCCVVLPFNWDDALVASKLDWKRVKPMDVARDALKDDIKIIAQAKIVDAEFAITDDGDSFHRYCATFKAAGDVQFKAIKLEDGFDRSFLDAGGQRDFTDELKADDEE